MFAAIRGGHRRRRAADGDANRARPDHLQHLQRSWSAALQRCSQLAGSVGAQLHDLGRHGLEALAPQSRAGAPALLLASVSSSAPGGEPKALLPSRLRPIKAAAELGGAPPAAAADGGGGGGGGAAAPAAPPADDDGERILISEVVVAGADGELKALVERTLATRPAHAYTVREVQDDVQRVFDTGFFSACRPVAEDTRDGVRLTVEVTPNAELRGFVATGARRLPASALRAALAPLAGRTLNFRALARAVAALNGWYEAEGVLGQVVDVALAPGGVARLRLAEAVVDRVALRYVDPATAEARSEGRTRPEVILRQLTTRPGQAYSLRRAKADIEAVYALGLFEDVSIRPRPAEGSTPDAPRVDLALEVKERPKTGGLSAGGGISTAAAAGEGALPGVIGTASYSQRNLFGWGQRLTAAAEFGQADSTFRVTHVDPWVGGDAHRTSRTLAAASTKASAAAIHGRAADDAPPRGGGGGGGGDGVYVARTAASVEYARPLGPGWTGGLGLSWQRAGCVDDAGRPLATDVYGAPLTFTGRGAAGGPPLGLDAAGGGGAPPATPGAAAAAPADPASPAGSAASGGGRGAPPPRDTVALGLLRVAYQGAGATAFSASMEQAVPLRRDWLNLNRFTLRAETGAPLGPRRSPRAPRLWLCARGGAVLGDLPPYEAFPIGGTNSVRGYAEGGVGSARHYAAATAEVHVPVVAPFEACLFCDAGTDLGSGASVPGDPGGARDKPGAGLGAGAGVRVGTPIGPLRLEFAVNDRRERRFHLGVGSHG